ncbi:MAG TPA: tRNA (guanine(10)-N(2))-dimethyltransferase [Nitrososphaeraceae archaeon]
MKRSELVPIIEGKTKILVPSVSLGSKIPTKKQPVFFNSAAKLNRDISIVAYNSYLSSSHFKIRKKKKNNNNNNNNIDLAFADSLCGTGARGLRVAVEVPAVSQVYLNDVNPLAIDVAKKAAMSNSVFYKCRFSVNEVCKFLVDGVIGSNGEERGGGRFAIVDLDPFGSPAMYVDCVTRSVLDGGLVSITATDTAVLCGKYPDVCLRKYYGRPLKNSYSNETALRLLTSLISLTSARLGISICPLFAHINMHYLRIYAKVVLSSQLANRVYENIGYLQHCYKCGNRGLSSECTQLKSCELCGGRFLFAGPLWTGKVFDKEFVKTMTLMMASAGTHDDDDTSNEAINNSKKNVFCLSDKSKNSDKNNIVNKLLSNSIQELDDIPYYFTSDEIASRLKCSPHSLDEIIENLSNAGFRTSKTSFNPTAFKTHAKINEILSVLKE